MDAAVGGDLVEVSADGGEVSADDGISSWLRSERSKGTSANPTEKAEGKPAVAGGEGRKGGLQCRERGGRRK
ncbi:hypothetical protein Scep_021488 [Stephania cephalantha]|uniref:Uncharacterized protein n=1 Tax=Stephania cephalantha TaxID=152367 RepID=A0AAP0F4F6_9MAGN